MPIQWIDELDDASLHNKNILLRVDFNVPLGAEGQILDAERIEQCLPTIRRLMRAGAKLAIISHLGQPKGKVRPSLTLEPVASYLRDLLDQELIFVHECVGDGVAKILAQATAGSVLVLENLRFNPGEEKDDPVFAKLLARHMDIYVNDAFAVCHRAHASVVGVTKHFAQSFGGLLLKKEISALESITANPKRPLIAVIGGAKVSSKMAVLTQLLRKVDAILIGGAMAYTFLKAEHYDVGRSLVEPEKINLAQSLLRKAEELKVKIYLPSDHVVVSDLADASSRRVIKNGEFSPKDIGVDIGPETIRRYSELIGQAQTIFANGPMGMYEHDEFNKGSIEVMKACAASSGYSVVGGGDSLAVLAKAKCAAKINFVSTGGGALLEFLEAKKLPGLAALGFYD